MLMSIGRGLSPSANAPLFPSIKLDFTTSLPAEVTFTRASAATMRNSTGKLVQVSANEPRIDHTEDGTPLGLFIEPTATNKCENYNINPLDATGFATVGSGIISVVDDSTELAAAGLDDICTSGKVFKAEATSGSTFVVYTPGTCGNTNAHSVSVYARGVGLGSRTARLSIGGSTLNIAPAGDGYVRYKHEDLTPDSSGRRLTLSIDGNETLYFILYQLEESTYCTSVIPTEGSAVTRPTDRAYISNVDQAKWFNPAQGYMICRYSQERLRSTDSYAAVLNSGASSNAIGLRLDQTNHNLRAYMISGGVGQFLLANLDYQIEKTLNTGGIRWNNDSAEILSNGETNSAETPTTPTGINQLEIGARNGGTAPICGHVKYIEIGTKDINLRQLGNRLQKNEDFIIVGAGQSLMRGHFKSQESNAEDGKQKHRELIGQAERDKAVIIIDGSTGGSAAVKSSNDTYYWYDLATSGYGPAFNTFYSALNTVGASPSLILWAQGEEDSHSIGITTSRAEYKTGLETIFADMRSKLGDIPIYIQRIGRRTSFANSGGVQEVREVQNELIAENDWCFDAAEVYDLTLYDQVHLTDADYVTAATRNSAILLGQAGSAGPAITAAIRSGTNITVTLTHDGGSDFTPTSGIEGFKFFEDGSEVAVISAVRTDSTTITLTLASEPSSGTEMLYYGYDDMSAINTANIIRDDSASTLPLRTSYVDMS